MTIKLFAFEFVNSYNSLVYIAFFKKGSGEGCDEGNSCMPELAIQLGVIFVTSLLLNGVELGLPFLMQKFRKW